MTRAEQVKNKVDELYKVKNPGRADWADWLYGNHVFVVADYAGQLADRFHANKELSMAIGMLHDIADAIMKREDAGHEEKSLSMARYILKESGFIEEEIRVGVDDAIRLHSCHNNDVPQSLDGKILSTADALGHLMTDFYSDSVSKMSKRSAEENRKWVLEKIERDINKKIFFDEVREEAKPYYEKLKIFFSVVE